MPLHHVYFGGPDGRDELDGHVGPCTYTYKYDKIPYNVNQFNGQFLWYMDSPRSWFELASINAEVSVSITGVLLLNYC